VFPRSDGPAPMVAVQPIGVGSRQRTLLWQALGQLRVPSRGSESGRSAICHSAPGRMGLLNEPAAREGAGVEVPVNARVIRLD
jgi:hypothetical protein